MYFLSPHHREAALGELLRLHRDKVFRFALRLTGNVDQAMDLTQDAFVRAFQNIDRFDRDRRFESWIFTILNRLYLNAATRYEARHVFSWDGNKDDAPGWEPAGPSGEEPSRAVERAELRGSIQLALNRLPIHFRAPLILCDIEGMSYDEISRALTCPTNTVRTRIHRARRQFRELMEPYVRGELVR